MGHGTRLAENTISGAVAGLLATLPMSLTMLGIKRMLPVWQRDALPPRKVTMKLARKLNVRKFLGPKKSRIVTALSHFGYGTTMGAIYGSVTPKISAPGPISGTLFGLVVWAGSYFGLLPAAQIRHPKQEQKKRHAMMAVAHVVWGGTLGLLFQRIVNKTGEPA